MQCIVRNVTEIFFISKLFSTMRFLFLVKSQPYVFIKMIKKIPNKAKQNAYSFFFHLKLLLYIYFVSTLF